MSESLLSIRKSRQGIRPPTVGSCIRDIISTDLVLTQDTLAAAMRVTRYSINQLVNGKRHLTPDMALRLSAALGTTVEFWLNVERAVQLYDTRRQLRAVLKRIKPIRLRRSLSQRKRRS
jgi:antitoxin HigA-1